MKLLITGGAGFMGSNFVHYWLKHHPEDQVVNFDLLTYAGNLENLRAVENHQSYRFVRGDIADPEAVDEAMRGADAVINFAAETHVDRSILGPGEFVRTNVVGAQVLLDAARRHGVRRFHQISTDEVFGHIPLDVEAQFDEQSPYSPRSPYAASKAAADHLASAAYTTHGLPVTITHSSNNYGPYHFPEKFIPLAITNLLEGKKIPIYNPGNQVRDWLYVDDHSRAVELVILGGRPGERYCVGGVMRRQMSNYEVAKTIAEILGSDESALELVKDRPGHDVKYILDSAKIRRELGWEPKHHFEEWLAKTVHWFKHNVHWWKPLKEKNREYYRKQYGK